MTRLHSGFLFAATAALLAGPDRPPSSVRDSSPPPALVSGLWSGGLGTLEGDKPRWESLYAEIEVEGRSFTGTAHFGGGASSALSGKLTGERARFQTQWNGKTARFEGRVEGDRMLGQVRSGRAEHDFQLVYEGAPDEAAQEQLAGLYEVDSGHRILIHKSKHLLLTDFKHGSLRVLYARGGDHYVAGNNFSVPVPTETRFSFERDANGRALRLRIEAANGRALDARPLPMGAREPFSFRSGEVELHGTLHLPAGQGRHPAMVWVHGSGEATRAGAGSWPIFANGLGFAVLAVDKRGVGASGGRYALPDGGHDNEPHMRRRAGDVLAAVAALKAHDAVDGGQVGLIGASQAGWVQAIAGISPEVAFTITLSGGATQLDYENEFSRLAQESDADADSPTVEEVLRKVARRAARGHDFRGEFAAAHGPGLWLYGAKDRSNPSQMCAALLEEVAAEHDKDFTVKMFADGNHSLRACRYGGAAENGALGQLVPGLHAAIETWLKARGFGPAPRPR